MSAQTLTSLGLMSGTSMDGIDVALVRTDGESLVERGPFLSLPYDEAMRAAIKQGLVEAKSIGERRERPGSLLRLERELTLSHVAAVKEFLFRYGLKASDVDLVGFHGQTLLHRPDAALTVQLGDGPLLARETGIRTVFDLRARDMTAGGQGAPLVPAYHRALAARLRPDDPSVPVAFVNIGGISNLTFVGGEDGKADGPLLVAFDSGPGNMLIDQWMEATCGRAYDAGGEAALAGRVLPEIVAHYLAAPFFSAAVRRSLDRGDFPPLAAGTASLADGARTLAHLAAAAIIRSCRHLPAFPAVLAIAGGGRLNAAIMLELRALAARHGARVITVDEVGLDGDAMEAEAWAYLAVRAARGLPITFPGTTGVASPMTGGAFADP